MLRSRSELAALQRRVVERFRRERGPAAPPAGGSAGPGPVGTASYARVAQVVSADPQYGPHLTAVLQAFSGTPPAIADAGAAAVRCYPSPGRSVSDFAVDEIVRLITARGAYLAEKVP